MEISPLPRCIHDKANNKIIHPFHNETKPITYQEEKRQKLSHKKIKNVTNGPDMGG
jgi:hypothetical protein